MMAIPDNNWRYLGDGVYAGFDGHGIWLHANHHVEPTDRIYLEPDVYNALIDFSHFIALMKEKYISEYIYKDGQSQHKDGLNFVEWVERGFK